MTGAKLPHGHHRFLMDAVLQMQLARSELDIFSALCDLCSTNLGLIAFAGYLLSKNRQGTRQVYCFGDRAGEVTVANPLSWLTVENRVEFDVSQSSENSLRLTQKLASGGRTFGGVAALFDQETDFTSERFSQKTQMTADFLACFHDRRLSQMVLEALEESEEAISFYDNEDGVLFSNSSYHKVFPHYPEGSALIGKNHIELYRMDLDAGIIDDPVAQQDPEAYLADRETKTQMLRKHQREIQKIGGRTYIYSRTRSKTGSTMSRRIDITEQVETESKLRQREKQLQTLVYKDPLSELWNRAFLQEHFETLQKQHDEGKLAGLTVFLVDLNDFKSINDKHGHNFGDLVLKIIARRLSEFEEETTKAVRLGGDEFLLVLEDHVSIGALTDLGERLVKAFSQPLRLGNTVLKVGVSVGVASFRGDHSFMRDVLVDADLAMYEAKIDRQKDSRLVFFDESLREKFLNRRAIAEDALPSLQRGEFELHYQPQFLTESGRLSGFEALVRWRHASRGLLSPGQFIPVLEENGMIDALGEWVLKTACEQARSWPDDIRISVNVSPVQFRGNRFFEALRDVLAQSGIAPERLELEITESIFLENEEEVRAELYRWKELGVRVALDDFGSGYSSLGYLSRFPFDKIKIDRGFIGGLDPLTPDAADTIILKSIIELGHQLGKSITAEGVERVDQLRFLADCACTEVQGFYLGYPTRAEQLGSFIRPRLRKRINEKIPKRA